MCVDPRSTRLQRNVVRMGTRENRRKEPVPHKKHKIRKVRLTVLVPSSGLTGSSSTRSKAFATIYELSKLTGGAWTLLVHL
jgi:hypothetical protein